MSRLNMQSISQDPVERNRNLGNKQRIEKGEGRKGMSRGVAEESDRF